MVITLDQMAPPECPHRTHGTVFSSGCPDWTDISSRALRKDLSEPRRGSIQSSEAPGEVSVFFAQHVAKRAQQRAVPLLGQRLPVQVVSGGFSSLARLPAGTVLVDDHAAQARGSTGDPEGVSDARVQFVRGGRG
jgi:hypothetical protein